MKKVFLIISLFILLTTPVYSGSTQLKAAQPAPQGATVTDPIFPGLGIIPSANTRDGRVSTTNLAILGPSICINFGDPYSPLNSPFAPGSHTYQYRIRIPASYPSDTVRVELFDPDSINQAANSLTISRSSTAINNGLSPIASKTCGVDSDYSSQIHPCLLWTDEFDLVSGAPNLDIDQVNPNWLVRIDENRGTGGPPGNGACGIPSIYNPAYNTSTLFQLVYYQEGDTEPEKVPLVGYFGQTGDGVRDNGDHNTDMHWVSPGADVPFSSVDTPGNTVPAIAQTIDSFEVDLTTDVPNIFTDAQTGDRYLYLEVTAMSGASENGYEIWAGPSDYVNSVPSEVNARNLYILNNTGSHDSQGLEITAVDTLVQNSTFRLPMSVPLATIGPEAAGQTITIDLFDSDAGAEPPLVFYFDTLAFTPDDTNPLGYDPALTDWAMAFAVAGQDDPDGVAEGIRCAPGSCQSQWVDPAYQITIPGDMSSCDWQNPTAENCTPFYGGRLMVLYDSGYNDTYTWELPSTLGGTPLDQSAGCSAFPIAIQEGARSVTAPGTGSNPYPAATDFDYPVSPPTYDSFVNHDDDMALVDAQPGDVFLVQNGFGSGNFGWLAWNEGIVANATTLGNSLSWPGNTLDYNDYSDAGTAVPGSGFNHVVRGYIEPGDPTDQELHIADLLLASNATINDSAVTTQLNEHIDYGRTLRLPISNTNDGTQFQVTQFGIFRLIGYNSATGWLLLEFVNFDTSCGQLLPTVATTFNAVADSTVFSNRPDRNWGSSIQLRLDAAPTANSYLRFDVQGLTGTVNSATLRLFVDTTSSAGFTAHEVAANSWVEGDITFSNAPVIGEGINISGATTSGSYVEVDVTSYITGNGLVSLALTTMDTSLIIAQSREGANPPELIVETIDGGPPPTPTNTPVPPTPSNTPTPTNTPVPSTPTPTNTAVPPTATPTNTPIGPTPTFTSIPRCDVQFEGEAVAGNNIVFVTGEVGIDVTVTNLTTGLTLGSGNLGGPFDGHACEGFAGVTLNPPLDSGDIGDVLLVSENGVPDNNDTTIVVGATPTATSVPGGSTFTFSSADDAMVLGNRPTINYGAATILGTDDSPDILSYLKFNVAGLDGPVASATLRVFVTTAVAPFNVAQVVDNSWSQATLTYSDAPATGPIINGSGAISGGTWVEIDVTSYINGDGTFSVALLADTSGRNLFNSSETGNGPELVVVTAP